jgi:hypothetical protein
MRALLTALAALALSQAACGGGSIGMGFTDSATPTGTPGAEAEVDGHFSTTGSFDGKYTIVTSIVDGADSCVVSANGGPAATTVQVDTSGDASIALVVTMVVNKTATLEADCQVKATNDDDSSTTTGATASVTLP